MLYCARIDMSEGIDLAERNNSKYCMICYYWLFNFQDHICKGLKMLCISISDIIIITIKHVDYCCIIHNISKSNEIIRKFCI